MKQRILNLSQKLGLYTFQLSVKFAVKGKMRTFKFIDSINTEQMKLDIILRTSWSK